MIQKRGKLLGKIRKPRGPRSALNFCGLNGLIRFRPAVTLFSISGKGNRKLAAVSDVPLKGLA